jgi:hypothetical protein
VSQRRALFSGGSQVKTARTPVLLAVWIVTFLAFFLSGLLNKFVDFFLTVAVLYALLCAWFATDLWHWLTSLG